MPPARPRTEAEWQDRTPAYRRRVENAAGYSKADWLAGRPLPRGEFGHRATPSHGAAEASRNLARFPIYSATHEAQINAYRRQQGMREYGKGPRGRNTPTTISRQQAVGWGPYTQVSSERPDGFHTGSEPAFTRADGGTKAGALRQAQNYARESGAPPGAVVIWEVKDDDGEWEGYQVGWTDEET